MSRINSENINLGESFVIKVDPSAHTHSGKLQRFVEENTLMAKSILEKAKLEAEKIIADAKESAIVEATRAVDEKTEEARQKGYQEGFEAGYQDGNNKLNSEVAREVMLFNSFVENTFDIKRAIIKSAYSDITNLVLEIADKVCHRKLELDEGILFDITKSAISLLKDKEVVTVIVNPIMRDAFFALVDRLKGENSLIGSIKIVEDPSISPDGTIVESLSGRIDSRISSQIEEITNRLLINIQTANEEELVADADDILKQISDKSFDVNLPDEPYQIVELEVEKDDSL